ATVTWSVGVRAVEARRIIRWWSVAPGAAHVAAESHRRIGVERWDCLHDGRWSCQLTLQIGIRRGLAVELVFQEIDGLLLGLHFFLECCDLVALRLGEGLHTTGMCVAGIIRTFPRGLRLACLSR